MILRIILGLLVHVSVERAINSLCYSLVVQRVDKVIHSLYFAWIFPNKDLSSGKNVCNYIINIF